LAFTEQQIETLSPNPAAFNAGKSLAAKNKWKSLAQNERAAWGEIQGSGKNPYQAQVEIGTLACKCNCPSRQFPCKHNLALMLLFAKLPNEFAQSPDEPEWVKSWLDKRLAKANKPPPKERTEEDQGKLDKAKEKTQAERFDSVRLGVIELELWLKDLVRIGILELPNKSATEFEKVAARMVDAKAPGLAGWVRSLAKLNFGDQTEWQSEALGMISRLFLLIRTFQNYENLSPLWQITIKNLVGWSQSAKELLVNPEAETLKDKWLIVGQEVESNDDITTQRNWLIGCNTNRKALILNFSSNFAVIENPIFPGSIINAELAFFPSILPFRAAIKMQRSIENELEQEPESYNSWKEVYELRNEQLKINPWTFDILFIIKDARMVKQDDQWIIYDSEKFYTPVVPDFDLEKVMKWLVISGNRPQNAACILRNGKVLPLGIFQNNQYMTL
jgi:hypothetical protein